MLKFGWARRNASVDCPIFIRGQAYERISKGVWDENMITALVIDDGNTVSIMVSGDFPNIGDGIIFEVRDAVKAKNSAIPVENILFNATHTHTAPRFMKLGVANYDKVSHDDMGCMMPDEYRKIFLERASDAIVEAYEKRDEGSYAYGYGYAVVAHHRRPVYFDDLRERPDAPKLPSSFMIDRYAKMYGNTNDPMFAGYEGNVDSSAYFMFTFDKNDKLTGAVINVPCPSQNSEVEDYLSADYWAQVRELVTKKYGDIYILSQCACAGDMSPRTLHAKAAERRKYALKYEGAKLPEGQQRPQEFFNRMEIAERIMTAFDDTYSWASKDKIRDAKLSHSVKNISLEAWKITEEQYEAAKAEYEKALKQEFVDTGDQYADFKANTTQSFILMRFEDLMKRYEKNIEAFDVEIHVISLGDIAFVSNPFELYINYQHRIQARSPYVQTFAVQLAAPIGEAGYLCTASAAYNMGYGANFYSCRVSPEGGNTLVEETIKELKKLREK